MDHTKNYKILRLNREKRELEEDIVVVEHPFTIFINNREIITLLCTPKSLRELTIGFLYSEGFINSIDVVERIQIDKEEGRGYVYLSEIDEFAERFQGKRTITSGCGKGTVFYNVIDSFRSKKVKEPKDINIEEIKNYMRDFSRRSELFRATGGVHSCGLYGKEGLVIFEEDIGRHNALDKILGKALDEDMELRDKMILTSGRISSEILIKVAKREMSTIVSRAAPTSLAIDMAKELNINLIGFVRGERLNIYTNLPD